MTFNLIKIDLICERSFTNLIFSIYLQVNNELKLEIKSFFFLFNKKQGKNKTSNNKWEWN